MLFLAQAASETVTKLPDPSSSQAIGWVLASLFCLGNIGLVLKQLFQRTPPLHEEFASKKELEALSERVDGIAAKIQESFDALDGKRSRSIAGLHQALERATESIRGEVKKDVGHIQNRITDMFGEIQRILGRFEK